MDNYLLLVLLSLVFLLIFFIFLLGSVKELVKQNVYLAVKDLAGNER